MSTASSSTHARAPNPRLPVEAYLRAQQRFAHLFKNEAGAATVTEIQAEVDAYWSEEV